ncbi:hypothetical protein [Polycladidibacter hongkongensis]|uniref:hypothetical protein n=1 Tax=Polycladidibacter hongkongensis TaxID=1647556 RepID=UPI000A50E504|nr:hypothetical protein [Pseudovibrio hongkongensis]
MSGHGTFVAGILAATIGIGSAAQARDLYPFNYLLPNDMTSAPRIYGSQYDCKIRVKADGKANVYQAFVSGSFYDPTRQISSVACFRTQKKCKAYLNFMRGYLDYTNSAACQKGYYTGLFNWD